MLAASLPSPPPRAIIYGGMCLYRLTVQYDPLMCYYCSFKIFSQFKPQGRVVQSKVKITGVSAKFEMSEIQI